MAFLIRMRMLIYKAPALLLEDGGFLLLESGDKLLLE